MSAEHHVRYEVQVRNAANWRFYSLQTEEERGEGGFALPLEIVDSRDITVANFHIYRVISSYQPFRSAVTVSNSRNIRFRNLHCYSNSKVSFDAAVTDVTRGAELRQREFARLSVGGTPVTRASKTAPRMLDSGASVRKLADGFFNISGGAAAPNGDFYFVDAKWQRIHRWSVADSRVSTVHDAPLEPVNLAFDKSGNLLVVSYAGNGTVYALKPGAALDQFEVLKPVDAAPRPGLTVIRPVGDWRVARDAASGQPPAKTTHYLSPDGSTFIPAGRDFVSGATSWGVKSADLIRAFGLAPVRAGEPFLRHERSRGHDLARHARARRQLHVLRAVRPAGRGERGG